MSRKYDQEFKIEAIRLAEKSDNASLIERNLNIGSGCIHRWRRELQNNNSPNTEKNQINNIKLKQLEHENKRLRMERDILKKAVHIFTTEPNRYSGL